MNRINQVVIELGRALHLLRFDEPGDLCERCYLLARELLAKSWVAYYACPECGGTGFVPKPEGCICTVFRDTGGFRIADLGCPVHGVSGSEPGDGPWLACSSEHVELVNPFDGSVVFADPSLAEWRHTQSHTRVIGPYTDDPFTPRITCSAFRCPGWVPLPMEADNDC